MLSAIMTSYHAGGTFIAWTIYYLSGVTHYYRAKEDRMLEICYDPINLVEKNAHNFWPNLPMTKKDFDQFYDKMRSRHDINFLFLHQVDGYTQNDVNDKLKSLDKIIFVDISPSYKKYYCMLEGRIFLREQYKSDGTFPSWEELHMDVLNRFYSDSLKRFGSIETPWDHREFLALIFDWDKKGIISDRYDRKRFDHFYVDNVDVWLRFDQILPDVFGYLGLAIDQTRLGQWSQVYSRWKMFHKDRISFCLYFDSIVDGIVSGIDMDLGRFNLDVVQEAALLRSLMEKHGLNLRAYGLERFKNTAELHKLLEPNIHS